MVLDIGKEERTIRTEPARVPEPQRTDVPQRKTRPARRFDPITPTRPVEDPDTVPVKVPSK